MSLNSIVFARRPPECAACGVPVFQDMQVSHSETLIEELGVFNSELGDYYRPIQDVYDDC